MAEAHTRIDIPDAARLPTEGAQIVTDLARQAIEDRGRFTLALSGGNTPRPLYKALAKSAGAIDWEKVQIFFSDERFVPPDSEDSNYHMANETLLSRAPIPPRQVHRVATVDISPEQSAALYQQGIRRVFEVGDADVPHFDLILLGLGPDGHTASLFPDTDALGVTDALVVANWVGKLDSWRITFTYPLINAAHAVMFVVDGEEKAQMVRDVVDGREDLPAAHVHPTDGELIWLLDAAAASQLPAKG